MAQNELNKQISDAKFMMWYTKPLVGYLGNQYLYWKSEYERLKYKKQNP